jgi:hypothetical protein
MIEKHPPFPHRVRKVPKQFSWLDHRLVRDRHIDHCSHPAAALYLFLVTVADEQGLSYYSDPSLMKRLSMDENTLAAARQNLIHIGLIAYEKPIYQVLALDPEPVIATSTARSSLDQPLSLAQIFKRMAGDIS